LKIDPRLGRLRDVVLFVAVAVVLAPLVMAALQVLTLEVFGLLPSARGVNQTLQLWAGSATGVGLLAPPLLLGWRRWPGLWATVGGRPEPDHWPQTVRPRPGWQQGLEAGAAVVLTGLAIWVAYGGPRGASLDYSYVLFVPLLYVAVVYSFVQTAFSVLALNVGAAVLTGEQVARGGGLTLQFGLLTVTVSGLLLGAVLRDRKQLTGRLRYLALHDPLTGLGNRRLFAERLDAALSATPAPEGVAVLLLDFDNFKAINDSLGHDAGDQVLVDVGGRLRTAVRPDDTVARLGGDEFAVLLPRLADARQATEAAERVLRVLAPVVPVKGFELQVRASLGLAVRDAGQDGDTLLRNADVALYHAKAHRRGHVQLFDASMHRALLDRVELEADLRAALSGGALEVYYQPLVELGSGQLRGFEALVRWPHPTRGLLLPGEFLPLAEDTGLIIALDRWMLRAATREAARWPTPAGAGPLSLGINLSAAHVHLPDLVDEVCAVLDDSGLPPGCLMLELTERVLTGDVPTVTRTLRALRRLGLHLALDNFGTGTSSLGDLRQLPVSHLKIDRSFIATLGVDGDDPIGTELARAIAALGHALGLTTIAEGVATPEQHAAVRALGYTQAQGFHLSAPLPVAQARELALRRPLLGVPLLGVDAPPQD
jgi:diguanylate cyclase (GGDEF)-like protein